MERLVGKRLYFFAPERRHLRQHGECRHSPCRVAPRFRTNPSPSDRKGRTLRDLEDAIERATQNFTTSRTSSFANFNQKRNSQRCLGYCCFSTTTIRF